MVDDEDDDNKVVQGKPLARTGSNLMPMVALGMVAIVLGALVFRGAGPAPVTRRPGTALHLRSRRSSGPSRCVPAR